MTKKFVVGGAVTALALSAGIAGMVSAQSAATATGLTEEQVIEIALAEVPGEVQDVERESEDGVDIYEIELIAADGSEMEIEINAETGEILEVKEDGRDCDKDDEDDDEEA